MLEHRNLIAKRDYQLRANAPEDEEEEEEAAIQSSLWLFVVVERLSWLERRQG